MPIKPEIIALILHAPIFSDRKIGANNATNNAED